MADADSGRLVLPRCACGAPALAFRPGAEGEAAVLLGQSVPLRRGEPVAAWCEACWSDLGLRFQRMRGVG